MIFLFRILWNTCLFNWCFTSQSTIFQSYMWWQINVHAVEDSTYCRAPLPQVPSQAQSQDHPFHGPSETPYFSVMQRYSNLRPHDDSLRTKPRSRTMVISTAPKRQISYDVILRYMNYYYSDIFTYLDMFLVFWLLCFVLEGLVYVYRLNFGHWTPVFSVYSTNTVRLCLKIKKLNMLKWRNSCNFIL